MTKEREKSGINKTLISAYEKGMDVLTAKKRFFLVILDKISQLQLYFGK